MAKTASPSDSSVLTDLRAMQDRVMERIRELEPYVEELTILREQAGRMGIDLAERKPTRRSTGNASTRTRKPATTRNASTPSRRRRSAGGSRADQVLKLVQAQPGITIPELGTALGVDSTGLYRVVRNLEQDGQVRKDGRNVMPAIQSQTTESGGVAVEQDVAN